MEALKPELREALKAAHPGLTDEHIDEYERLTSMRFTLDPAKFRQSIADLDRQREQLIATRMPQFAQIERVVNLRLKAARPAPESPRVVVEIRGEDKGRR